MYSMLHTLKALIDLTAGESTIIVVFSTIWTNMVSHVFCIVLQMHTVTFMLFTPAHAFDVLFEKLLICLINKRGSNNFQQSGRASILSHH